jgi:N utilization substance protein A
LAVTITNEDIQAMNLLELRTGAKAEDVVVTPEAVVYLVQKGDLGRAIGKGGANIMSLKRALSKNVELIESADSLEGLLVSAFQPVEVKGVRVEERNGRKTATVKVDPANKGLAIGKGGEKIKVARLLAKRRFACDDVRIA